MSHVNVTLKGNLLKSKEISVYCYIILSNVHLFLYKCNIDYLLEL